MRLKTKDLLGTLLVAAITIPYVGYLINGEMPLLEDARGMAGVGLALGFVAYVVMEQGDTFDRTDKLEAGLATLSLIVGVVALAVAETAASEVLLAIFMASILVVWAVKMMDHAGALHLGGHPIGHA